MLPNVLDPLLDVGVPGLLTPIVLAVGCAASWALLLMRDGDIRGRDASDLSM